MRTVAVLGLGYVGLTLAVVLAEKGFMVYGVDINKAVVSSIRDNKPHFYEKGLTERLSSIMGKTFFADTALPAEKIDIYIISVGTPVDPVKKNTLLNHLGDSAKSVADHMADGALVILRSTIQVGTSRNFVKPLLDASHKKYSLAFCPERTIEGKALDELLELPQIVGGIDEESLEKAAEFFSRTSPEVVKLSTIEGAEMVKLLNNTYRDLTFAYSNEVSLLCNSLSLNSKEIISAANFKYKRSSIPLPGFVGGICLSKDSYILAEVAGEKNIDLPLIKGGRKLNELLPSICAGRAIDSLNLPKKDICSAKIFVSGFAFKGKPPTDDIRQSPTLELLDCLKKAGFSNIFGHDFIVPKEKITALGINYCSFKDGFLGAKCVFMANNHPDYSLQDFAVLSAKMAKDSVLFDAWGLCSSKLLPKGVKYLTL